VEKLELDFEYLVFAWEDDSHDTAYYLDSETGSVVLVQQDLEDLDEIREEIELHPSRFLYVPKPDHDRLVLDLSDFIYTVADESLKKQLQTACEGTNKFHACTDILNKHPDEMQRWKKWRHDAARERARKWLTAHNIEPA
jgi:hypothetical protein